MEEILNVKLRKRYKKSTVHVLTHVYRAKKYLSSTEMGVVSEFLSNYCQKLTQHKVKIWYQNRRLKDKQKKIFHIHDEADDKTEEEEPGLKDSPNVIIDLLNSALRSYTGPW